jgi:hypothetical protein
MSNIIFENKNLRIAYDEEKRQLLLTWNGSLDSKGFRNTASEIIRAIEQTKAESILSDNRAWRIISPNDYGWAAHSWFPAAEAKGVKKLATILSSDYFNRVSEKSIENMADVRSMEIKNFNTCDEAQNWLKGSKTSTCV